MGKFTWRIWPALSFTEIAGYMEAMERRGLRFRRLRCCGLLAEYEKTEGLGAEYCQDYFEPEKYREIQPYLELCAADGWEIVWQFEKHKIFRRRRDAQWTGSGSNDPLSGVGTGTAGAALEEMGGMSSRAAPVQSDEEIEGQNFRKAARKEELVGGALIWLLLCLAWSMFAVCRMRSDWIYTATWTEQINILALLPLSAGLGIWYLLHGLRDYFRPCRRRGDLAAPVRLFRQALRVLSLLLAGAWLWSYCRLALVEKGSLSVPTAPLLTGLLIISLLFGRYRRQQMRSEGFPADQKMEGVCWCDPPVCRRRAVIGWTLLAVWGIFGLWLAAYGRADGESLRASGYYCSEIYRKDVEVSYNWYFKARNENYAAAVTRAVAGRLERFGGPVSLTEEETEKIRTAGVELGGHRMPEDGWDESWSIMQGGAIIAVRCGSEVWFFSAGDNAGG